MQTEDMSQTHNKKIISTLCWDCAKAVGKCSWSKRFRPVKGWEIIPTHKITSDGRGYKSCIVIKCPEFEQDAVGGGLRRYKDGVIYVPMSKNT